jgi:hypothetical protein
VTDPEPEREPKGLDDWLRLYFKDSTLVPVVLVAAGCFTAVGGGIIAWAVRGRSLAAIAALVLLAGMSVDKLLRDWRQHGRFGLASRCLIGLWALSAAAAAAAVALGLA